MASRAAVDRVVARARLALERCELAVPIHFDACARAALADPARWVVADDVDASRAHPLVVPLARAATTTRRADRPRRRVGARPSTRDSRPAAGSTRARGDRRETVDALGRRGRAGRATARAVGDGDAATRARRGRTRARRRRRRGDGGVRQRRAGRVRAGRADEFAVRERVEAFLTRRVGDFWTRTRALIERHLARGDVTSALVTAEWCADGPYRGWSRPHAVHAATLARFGRAAEARDQARVALSVAPWWTMGEDGAMMRRMQTLSGYAGRSAADVRRTLEGGDVDGGGASGGEPAPTREETALKRAMDAMDAVAWGERGETWASVRERVAESLDEAGLRALSAHVLAPLRE